MTVLKDGLALPRQSALHGRQCRKVCRRAVVRCMSTPRAQNGKQSGPSFQNMISASTSSSTPALPRAPAAMWALVALQVTNTKILSHLAGVLAGAV